MQIVPTPNPTLDANYAALGVTHEQGVRSAFTKNKQETERRLDN